MFYKNYSYEKVKRFCINVFAGYGFSGRECEIITDVLLCADLFGTESHGIQRLIRYHTEIGAGMVNVDAVPDVIHETPVSAVIDANKGMGQVVGVRSMELAIKKAQISGIGMISVRNSNHYGIAGYYTEMAAEADLMGICMTNTEAISVPTFGKKAMLGTNPIALSFPADPYNLLFDASTTVVTRGKVEVYNKNEKTLPDGWGINSDGQPCNDAGEVLKNIIEKLGGGISPLGGSTELQGGHKGYGLGLIVDLFTGILSSGSTSNHVNDLKDQTDIAQFYMAVDYGLFGEKKAVKKHLSEFLDELRTSPKAEGQTRIYTHGEKEAESKKQKLTEGIPINERTLDEMRMIAKHHGIDPDID